jgi:4-amino-4-deoxy-L-arabinose transferase-like glycosyltransferase
VAAWLLPLGTVLLAAGVVALAFHPAPHNGGDNAAYITLAYSLLETGGYTELFDPSAQPHTKYPPVFPALLALVVALGVRSWAGLKLVAAVSTVVAVAATWLWARPRVGPLAATGVAAALALSSSVVYYSHWILSDPTFLAFTVLGLWALDRADAPGGRPGGRSAGDGQGGRGTDDAGPSRADGGRAGWPGRALPGGPLRAGWLAVGVVATALAYFTRSAGLPLLLALLVWLALGRRVRALAASAAALLLPALLWWLRGRGVADAQGEYVAEFWLANPYDPSLGRVGVGGLLERMVANAGAYLTAHLPGGIVGGGGGPLLPILGLALAGLGLAGWGLAVRRRIGPAELFLPLYAGLILLWPEVWSGDRFALPLYPLLFLYAASAIHALGGRFGKVVPQVVGAAALLAVLLPALGSWLEATRTASVCGTMARESGAFACYGPRFARFAAAARWSGDNLPEGAAVLSRKPRLFYVLGGVPSRTFPFRAGAEPQLTAADGVGARYVLLDEVDGQATRYLGSAIREQPGAWCALQGFGGDGGGVGTQLLGILPQGGRDGGPAAGGEVRIEPCPPAYVARRDDAGASYASSTSTVPLLDRLP